MSNTDKYNVNFFKPFSEHARTNKNLIITLALVWFIAVFGFQSLLAFLNEPTPEKSYTDFRTVWPEIIDNEDTSLEIKQKFSRSILAVLGKNISVSENHKIVLKKVLSWSVINMLADSNRGLLQKEPDGETIATAKAAIGLTTEGFDKVMGDLLQVFLIKSESEKLSAESKEALPGIMELYLVHNQNVLTDFRFLGFPFHYWYTSQFLLILFVVLCLTYALVIDRTNKKFKFVEEA